MWNLTIENILVSASDLGASDIHITEWKYIAYRIDGILKKSEDFWIIDRVMVKEILFSLLNDDKESIKNFITNHDLDFAYTADDWNSFRVNAFYKLGKVSFILRLISKKVFSMEELWLPKWTKIFTELKQWLILLTWPTGSGKSTSMVSILEEINKSRGEHILTIEDPVEYIFKDKKSIFSQREVWRDTKSFKIAMRAAMREDPDIVMVWELRDIETVHSALELAETGHLVISTLHTSSAVKTIDRLVWFFPLEAQDAIRSKLSTSLKWVLSQRLIPKISWWRIGIFELMLVNTWIENLIRSWKSNQIQGYIETGSKYGMVTMRKYADFLRDKWIIEEKDYINYFKWEDD